MYHAYIPITFIPLCIKGRSKCFFITFEMTGWEGVYVDFEFLGLNEESLTREKKVFLVRKIQSFSRLPPVRAKVVLIENDNVTEEDQIAVAKVNGIHYFIVCLAEYLIVMDLHYVRNDIIAQLLDWNQMVVLN